MPPVIFDISPLAISLPCAIACCTITPQVFAHTYKKSGAMGVDYGKKTDNPDYVDPNQEAADRMDTEQSIPVEPEVLPRTASAAPTERAPMFENRLYQRHPQRFELPARS